MPRRQLAVEQRVQGADHPYVGRRCGGPGRLAIVLECGAKHTQPHPAAAQVHAVVPGSWLLGTWLPGSWLLGSSLLGSYTQPRPAAGQVHALVFSQPGQGKSACVPALVARQLVARQLVARQERSSTTPPLAYRSAPRVTRRPVAAFFPCARSTHAMLCCSRQLASGLELRLAEVKGAQSRV